MRRENGQEEKEKMHMHKRNLSSEVRGVQSTLTDGQANFKQNNFLHLSSLLYSVKFLTR